MPSLRTLAVLLIEPDAMWTSRLRDVVAPFALVTVCHDFPAARRQLGIASFAYVVTNIRLAEYNGVQLVYAVRDAEPRCRAIAYTASLDVWLAREAQHAGAFYETRERMPVTLPALLMTQLPASDRRDPSRADRRSLTRVGGRRAWDQHLAAARGGR
jgi:DNA-binding NtrC family response regulator